MKILKISSAALLAMLAIVFVACQKDLKSPTVTSAAGKKIALDKLTLSCVGATGASITLGVTAGVSGAPAGISIQWMTLADFTQYGWPTGDVTDDQISVAPSFCKVSLSGVPGCASDYKWASGQTRNVTIGDQLFDDCGASSTCSGTPLECGTTYVFRAFAHNDPVSGLGKSPISANQQCSTLPCSTTEECTYTQGFWKTHGPDGCRTGNNSNMWPASVLADGLNLDNSTPNYTADQLCSILNTPAQGTNRNLAHQLIAALLNQAKNGTVPADVQTCIDGAIAFLATNGINNPATSNTYVTCLANYNEGVTGPGHCSSK